MNKIKKFGDFNISEGNINSEDTMLQSNFISAFKKSFTNAKVSTGYGNQDKIYDYTNGYVTHPITCVSKGWDCVDRKAAKILENNGFSAPTVKAHFFMYKPIGKTDPKPVAANIGLVGGKYLNYFTKFQPDSDYYKQMEDFKKASIKGGLNDDVLYVLFEHWKKASYNETNKGSNSWGYGSQAVTYITKKFESSYIIRDLDKALNKTKKKVEEYIRGHYWFEKSDLKFDWDGGVMYANGESGERWD